MPLSSTHFLIRNSAINTHYSTGNHLVGIMRMRHHAMWLIDRSTSYANKQIKEK